MSDNRRPLTRFFSGLGRILNVTRGVISALFSLVFIIIFLVLLSSLLGQQQLQIPDSGALRIGINGVLVDQKSYSDPVSQLVGGDTTSEYLVRDLVDAIDMAAEDDRIEAIVLVLDDFMGGGTSKIEEVGEALEAFKSTGKPILAVSDTYNQQQYLLASYASDIILNPLGMVDIRGLAAYGSYFGEALDKLAVNMHVFRTGEYKDAVEPLTASGMSEASRQQNQRLLDDIWLTYRDGITQRRAIDTADFTRYVEQFDQLLAEHSGDAAAMAQATGLVDRVLNRDEMLEHLRSVAGDNDNGDFYSHIDVGPYQGLASREQDQPQGPNIGLVVASGTIYDGNRPAGSIGGDSMAGLLRKAREEEDLAALVMRIDSPGGSAFASELIRRELALFAEADIPVVVSMGSLAASGGYWIATAADRILATPTTITGSIGAFAVVPTFEDSLAKLGIYSDGVKTAPLADALQLDRALGESGASILQNRIDHIYNRFLSIVADSRDMPREAVEEIAGGRVWSGRQAMEKQLVDQLGNQQDALEAAAELAEIDTYRTKLVQPERSLAERIAQMLTDRIAGVLPERLQGSWLKALAADKLAPLEEMAELSDPQHLYLYCNLCAGADRL